MTATLGTVVLIVALVAAVWSAVAALLSVRLGTAWLVSARRGMYLTLALVAFAVALLGGAFLRVDLSYAVVADHASAETPLGYRFAAMWASQEGSLMLWLLLLCVASSAVLHATRGRLREELPYATAVLSGLAAFFLFLVVVLEPPFRTLAEPPANGVGLMPLLRNPFMMAHPPILYAGYAGFAVPFAFAIGALAAGSAGPNWLRATRRYALLAWTFLAVGLALGARWSYGELGWGGYWAWDAVENAALMPWLTATAFLHSALVQERRGTLRVWTVSLLVATFALVLVGTLIVRSGMLSSIHAFGASTLGIPFVALIAVVVIGSGALIVGRRSALRTCASIDGLLSREAALLVNNLLLVGLTVVIFWGTFFPLISEALTGEQTSIGPPWFERFTVPLAIALLFTTGVGTALTWRRTPRRRLLRLLALPAAGAIVLVAVAVVATDIEDSFASMLVLVAALLTVGVVAGDWLRAVEARRRSGGERPLAAAARVTLRNRRRYGGYLVHAGLAVALVGIAASSAFQEQRDARLRPGEQTRVGDYTVRYRASTVAVDHERIRFGAVLDVSHGDQRFELRPMHDRYASRDLRLGPVGRIFDGEATSEIGLRGGLDEDLWVAVQADLQSLQPMIDAADRRREAMDPAYQAALLDAVIDRYQTERPPLRLRMMVVPGVAWLWIGGGLVIAGGLLALSRPRRRRAPAPGRVRERDDGSGRVPAGAPADALVR